MSALDKTGLEAAARAMCVEGGFDPDKIMANDGPLWRYYVPGAEAAISAYLFSAGVTEEQTPRVKQLVWEGDGNPFFAGCAVGVYYIWPNLALETPAPRTIKRYDNAGEAKVAAQADFEQRILSALEASRVAPASQKEAEPVAWRTYRGGYIHTSRPEIAAEWGDGAEPLYASPAPAVEPVGIKALDTCQTCQGNGEIVTDWDTYLHGDDDEHATAECPDCNGIGKVSPTPVSAPVGVVDNPAFDGTDGAHPAWWRGNDRGVEAMCEMITLILDGEDPSGVCREPVETVRRRVAALRSPAVKGK